MKTMNTSIGQCAGSPAARTFSTMPHAAIDLHACGRCSAPSWAGIAAPPSARSGCNARPSARAPPPASARSGRRRRQSLRIAHACHVSPSMRNSRGVATPAAPLHAACQASRRGHPRAPIGARAAIKPIGKPTRAGSPASDFDLAVGRAGQPLAPLAIAVAPHHLHAEGRGRIGVPGVGRLERDRCRPARRAGRRQADRPSGCGL